MAIRLIDPFGYQALVDSGWSLRDFKNKRTVPFLLLLIRRGRATKRVKVLVHKTKTCYFKGIDEHKNTSPRVTTGSFFVSKPLYEC